MANCYSKKPRPATTKKSDQQQPVVHSVECEAEILPPESDADIVTTQTASDDNNDTSDAVEPNDNVGDRLTPELIEITPEAAEKRAKYNSCRPRSKSAIEVPLLKSKNRRERRRISLRNDFRFRYDSEPESVRGPRLAISRNELSSGDVSERPDTPEDADFPIKPLVKSASVADMSTFGETETTNRRLCSKADEEFRELANKIIFGDKEPTEHEVSTAVHKVVPAARPTVRLQYSNSNICLRTEPTTVVADNDKGDTTQDIKPSISRDDDCFVTNLSSFDRATESARRRVPCMTPFVNAKLPDKLESAEPRDRCWTPKTIIPRTSSFIPDDNKTTFTAPGGTNPTPRATLPRMDSFHKLNSEIKSHLNSEEKLNGLCTVSMDPSILKLAECLKVGETNGGNLSPYLNSILRDKSTTTTFFPIADLLPAVERSLHSGLNQNRVPPPPEKIGDHDPVSLENELLLAGKDRLLNYEESLLLMREGVDLLRLKERNQAVSHSSKL